MQSGVNTQSNNLVALHAPSLVHSPLANFFPEGAGNGKLTSIFFPNTVSIERSPKEHSFPTLIPHVLSGRHLKLQSPYTEIQSTSDEHLKVLLFNISLFDKHLSLGPGTPNSSRMAMHSITLNRLGSLYSKNNNLHAS